MTRVAPYGSWRSPLSPAAAAAGSLYLALVAVEGDDTFWLERRPAEGGRQVVVRRTPDGAIRDVTPPGFNARTRVHEYGGGDYAVADGVVYFSNFADQRLYRQEPGADPRPVTQEAPCRYADGVVDRARRRLLCVREDHGGPEVVNTLAAVDLRSGRSVVLAGGNDFYAAPRLSPDGARLAWLTWNHPSMPWDGTELWVAEVAGDGALRGARRVAGGASESIVQPEWSPDGVLHFVSDRTGWWNLYRHRDGRIEPLAGLEAEFGRSPFVFGLSAYAFESPERIICAFCVRGIWRLALLGGGHLREIETPFTDIGYVRAAPGRAVFIGGAPATPPSVVGLDLATGRLDVLRRGEGLGVDAARLSTPQAIEFPTAGGLAAHGFYYPPTNPDHDAPPGDRPPLLVIAHGGPTSAARTALRPDIQFWTSRGFAVLDVNYGGSTGYGRAYRERLDGRWGIVDVDDCAAGARHLVARGLADPRRLAIQGASAGGYTTLAALAFRDVFAAGACHFGVSDLERLARHTHKFESRYLDRLIGPYPERADLYRERSPIHFVDRLSRPVIFFQGLEDPVVPPEQAGLMYQAVRAKGLPAAYLAFAGEAHGFRRAETVARTLGAELYFYSRVLGFDLAEPVEPVEIANL